MKKLCFVFCKKVKKFLSDQRQWIRKNHFIVLKTAMFAGAILLAVFLFLPANPVRAQSISDPSSTLQEGVRVISQPIGLPATDIRLIVANIIRAALGLMGMVLLVLILYGGYLWMTAGGNEEQISKAKKVLLNAVIGLVIILSAYAIVLFVMRMLGIGTGGGGGTGPTLEVPNTQNFQGSGALGGIIKDHYPARNQTDVPRNTKIVVTFRKPVLASSFIEDTNRDGIIGNCRLPLSNWVTDCDHALFGNSHINIKRVDNNEQINGAVVLTSSSTYNGVTGVYTIVIKPITDLNSPSGGYLGSDTAPVSYSVRLGAGIKLDDPANNNPSAFQVKILGNDYYEWQFTNSTALDLVPPYVIDVFPRPESTEVRNSVIQVGFSEPMDPIGIQGNFNTSTEDPSYFLGGKNIFLKIANSEAPLGTFNLTNGYRTLEFTPSLECGKNSCGNKIYCLPVCNKAGANCREDNYELLLRAARTISTSSFEAMPLSGVMDLAGNALDGNKNSKVEAATTSLPVFPTQKRPDNYFWDFVINDRIDATPPYLQQILPGKDAANIPADQEWSMLFSKRMRADSMYDIGLEEHPSPAERGDNIPLWRVPFSIFNEDNTTYTRFSHGPFLQGFRQYYFPIVTSTVEDVHFNCFYPGKGPSQAVRPGSMESPVCDDEHREDCCEVITQQNYAFCCNGDVTPERSDTAACLNYWKDPRRSPY